MRAWANVCSFLTNRRWFAVTTTATVAKKMNLLLHVLLAVGQPGAGTTGALLKTSTYCTELVNAAGSSLTCGTYCK